MTTEQTLPPDQTPASPRPNFLVFITDQQRADHLGCAGNPTLHTPNIDRLAATGVRFERYYVNNPLCQPARATLFTGLTPRGHHVRTNGIALSPTIPTFTEALRRAGYRTHATGKLHFRNYNEPAPTHAADAGEMDRLLESQQMWAQDRIAALPPNYEGLETVDFTGAHGSGIFGQYINWLRDQDPALPGLLTREAGTPSPTGAEQCWTMALPAELHYNTWVADRAIAFLRRHTSSATPQQPFFLWCSFPDPHHPYCPPEPWSNMYTPDEVHLPNRRSGELDDLPPHYRAIYERALNLSGRRAATRIRDDQLREIIARTYGMIAMVDHEVGRVMAEVEQLGLRRQTVIVFLSDHGEMLGDHWILNKGPFHFDGLLRVPSIWSWPGHFREGQVVDALANHLDFAPTFLDLARVPIPEGIVPERPEAPAQLPPWPGTALTPLLTGQAAALHEQVLIENDEDYLGLRLRTLITDRYQITTYPGQPYGELFDRQADPQQFHNLWDDAGYATLKRDLLVQLLDEVVRTDLTLPRRTAHA